MHKNTPPQSDSVSSVSVGDKIAYGIGNLSTGAAMQVLGTYIVFYSTAILGLPGKAIGAVMGLSILWDAITDPLMGYISDNTGHEGLGRRHPYLIVGAVGIALVNYLLWTIPEGMGVGARLLLVTAYVFLFKTLMTVYVTPYTALGAELSVDYNERTTIQGIKSVFFVLGLAFVSVAGLYWFFRPAPGYPTGQLNPNAYSSMGLAVSVLVVAAAAVSFLPTLKYLPSIRKRSLAFSHVRPVGIKDSLARVAANKPFRMIVWAYMFNNLASALFANLGLHVFTYTFGLGSRQIAVVVGVQLLFAIVSQPIWAAEARRKGKRTALLTGVFISILGSFYFIALVIASSLIQGNVLAFIPFSIAGGAGLGALFTLPLSMTADTIDLDEAEGGARIEGVHFGVLTFGYKLSQAVALFLIGFLLDAAGFDTALTTQRQVTILVLGLVLGIGATIFFAAAALQMRHYNVTEAVVEACRQRIAAFQAEGKAREGSTKD